MRRARTLVAGVALLVLPALGGVAAPGPAQACVHPYPCGDEWPPGLTGPFAALPVEHVRVPSWDGVELQGRLYRPDLPAGVGAPVILWSSPYFYLNNTPSNWPYAPVNIDRAVAEGYTVAAFSLRGTGASGGCQDFLGLNDQKDQAFLVEWLAGKAWSNHRVGAAGISYDGGAAAAAAIGASPHLKTVLVGSMVSDIYTTSATPQGAEHFLGTGSLYAKYIGLGAVPAYNPWSLLLDWAKVAAQRVCSEHQQVVHSFLNPLVDARNGTFFQERNLLAHFPNVTASVFFTHGFQDIYWAVESQEDWAWDALTQAPKRALLGQWRHEWPPPKDWWDDQRMTWFDYWLKGLGQPLGLGTVAYEDDAGTWRTTTAWPPANANEEVLYLAGGALAPAPGEGEASFLSVPAPGGFNPGLMAWLGRRPWVYEVELCGYLSATQLQYEVASAASVLLAGNPFAFLRLRSDQPGGLVGVHLYDVGPDFRCDGTDVKGAKLLTWGTADLRFHNGTFQGHDFPVATPTHVRIDMLNLAHVLEPGHKLVAVVTHGDPLGDMGQPYFPNITVLEDDGALASHLVLPIVEGTLGGGAPTVAYPPRPFLPAG